MAKVGWLDSSCYKGTCCQDWVHEAIHWNPQGDRCGAIPANCALTFTRMQWLICVVCGHTELQQINILKIKNSCFFTNRVMFRVILEIYPNT